jgi:hypothetical protein
MKTVLVGLNINPPVTYYNMLYEVLLIDALYASQNQH